MRTPKAVFITGAAAGIGRKTAIAFARKGFTVGAFDIDDVGLKTLTEELDRVQSTLITGHLDVTDSDEMSQRLEEFTQATGGRLDVMINNAGILRAGRFEELDLAGHFKEIDINTKGVVTGLYAAFPYLRTTPARSSSTWPRPAPSTVRPNSPTTAPRNSSSAASPKPSTWNGAGTESG